MTEADRPVVATFPREVWTRMIATLVSGIVLQTLALGGAGLLWALSIEKTVVAIEAKNDEQDKAITAHAVTLGKLADLASVERVGKLEDRVERIAETVNQLVGELRARGVISPKTP